MKTYLLFTQGDGTADQAQQLAQELGKSQIEAQAIDGDGIEGSRLMDLYDITQRPAVVVTTDEGQMVHRWLGQLPPAGDISYYVHSR